MIAIKLFYDNFTDNDVAGMFSWWHLIYTVIFVVLLVFSLYACRKANDKQIQKIIWWVTIIVTLCEIFKISIRIAKGGSVDNWIPLYYCSLFIYAIWMTRSKTQWLSRMGYAFITMGGILAACLFTLYPSTSLAIYPAWHPASMHSMLYHLVMAFTGILVLWKKQFTPTKKDAILYGIYVFIACVIGYFINEYVHSNCMFLHHAFKLPVLDDLLKFSHPLYMLVVVLAQAVAMYWLNYAIYKLILTRKEKKL